MTGLSHASGDFVFLIDIDLEEEPELLSQFWNELQNNDNLDVVYGVQESRKGGWFEKYTGGIFWKIFNSLAHVNISENPLTVRLMSKNYIRNLVSFKEKELFLAGIFELVGFKQKSIEVKKDSKKSTTYNLTQKIKLLNNAIVSFSSFPLYLSFYMGSIISIFSFSYGIFLIISKLLLNNVTSGWTSVMVSIWFLSGVLLLTIGILGLYLSKIFSEVKNRPIIVKKAWQNNE
jgi:putative glycosyltransferase